MYKCNICETEFNKKHHLENHLNRINKCNIKTDFHCNNCNKYFKKKQKARKIVLFFLFNTFFQNCLSPR